MPIVRKIQLYATGSATSNAVAQITVPVNTTLVGIQAVLRFDSSTDNASCDIELSPASAAQLAVNGAQDPFLRVSTNNNFVTSGMTPNVVNQQFSVRESFRAGEFIYLHAAVGGTGTYVANFILHFSN